MKLTETPKTSRQTKYVTTCLEVLRDKGHATNRQMLEALRGEFPDVSATTVHRVMARLKARGLISCAPKTTEGSERYDIVVTPHHHFMCTTCSGICDVPDSLEARRAIDKLKSLSGDCEIAGTLTLRGTCKKCKERSNQ